MQHLLCFDWCGKMAHFRKFYANSSALSYSIPPRTTVLGLLAAILGLERDTYYDTIDQWLIGIETLSPVRKIFQKFNYLKFNDSVKLDEFAGIADNRTQISTELLLPTNLRTDLVRFRIYVGVLDANDENFAQLQQQLANNNSVYGVSLGTANLLAHIENYQNNINFEHLSVDNETSVTIKTAMRTSQITLADNWNDVTLEQDVFPLRLKLADAQSSTKTRIASEIDTLIYPLHGKPVNVYCQHTNHLYNILLNQQKFTIALL
jgi:CRISPR-associated protein Cas5h